VPDKANRLRKRERLQQERPWGQALRAWLDLRGLAQAELARAAGLAQGTVAHAVRGGHCSTATLMKISAALGVDVADLFTSPSEVASLMDRRDRLIVAVLKELTEDAASAVAETIVRRHAERRRDAADARLPFADEQ
jgi:transcriptional regulator with XRE-family HTH domain